MPGGDYSRLPRELPHAARLTLLGTGNVGKGTSGGGSPCLRQVYDCLEFALT